MAEIKIYGTLNNATSDKAIVKAEQVVGGYMSLTTSERTSLPSAVKKNGMLVYDTTESKMYQLINDEWVEFKTSGDVTGVKGNSETSYRNGNVNITATNIGVEEGAQVNKIETIKRNGTELTITDKAVDIEVPTGALASKDTITTGDITDIQVSDSTIGSATKGIYLNNGTLTATSHSVEKDVPSDALFTDTTYTNGDGLKLTGTTFSVDTDTIQEKLTAGENITIKDNKISAIGGGVEYTAGDHISIVENKISATYEDATTTTSGLMSASDKTKLDNYSDNSSTLGSTTKGVYLDNGELKEMSHSLEQDVTSSSKLTDTTYTAGSGLALSGTEFSVDETVIQHKLTIGNNISIDADNKISATDTTYENATSTTSGLMSATDKAKLDNYSDATSTIGSNIKGIYLDNGVLKETTYSVSKDVPNDAVFTDTTYESKEASQGGTDVSLVTTGEKYTWNNKQNSLPTTTTSGKVLKSTSNAGTVEWGDAAATGVTSIIAGTGLTGGTITSTGTIAVDTTKIQEKLTKGDNIIFSGNTISAIDTTYESKTASEGGTDVSLVTTGEKYNWNAKQDAVAGQVDITIGDGLTLSADGVLSATGGQGTTDYTALTNKPQINSVELTGNKSLSDLGIQSALTSAQLSAVNSGITSDKVNIYNGYATTIASKQGTLTAGTGIAITTDNVISCTASSATWGNITGTLSNQTDLQNALAEKQSVVDGQTDITIGDGLSLSEDGVLSATGGSGVSDYASLTGKPAINGHELASGANTLATLGIQATLTTAQQNAVDSGITSTKVSTYDGYASTISGKQSQLSTTQLAAVNSGITSDYVASIEANTNARHTHDNKTVLDGITSTNISTWNAKQTALTNDQLAACNSGITASGLQSLNNYSHTHSNKTILDGITSDNLVTSTEKETWNSKQDAVAGQADITLGTGLSLSSDNVLSTTNNVLYKHTLNVSTSLSGIEYIYFVSTSSTAVTSINALCTLLMGSTPVIDLKCGKTYATNVVLGYSLTSTSFTGYVTSGTSITSFTLNSIVASGVTAI